MHDRPPSGTNEEVREALRDILFLYADLAGSYQGFGHGVDTGTFDPFRFLDVSENDLPDVKLPTDLDLLRQGSAMALLCGLYDLWNEAEDVNLDHPWISRLRRALTLGRFRHCPDIERVMLGAFERHSRWDDPWLHRQVQPIYERYVVAYFARLVALPPHG